MNLSDSMHMFGALSIFKVYDEGGVERVFSEGNLIVSEAKKYLLSSIYQEGVPSDPIVSFKVGTGGTYDTSGLYPKAPSKKQLDLLVPLLTVPTGSLIADPDNLTVKFLIDITSAEANGSMISEAALFKKSGKIFNVKNFPGIPKTNEFSIHFEWSISYG